MFNFLKTHGLLRSSDFYISTINYFIVRTKKAIFSFSKTLVAVSFLVLMWPSRPPSASRTLLLPSRVTGGWCPPAGGHHHCSVFLIRSLKRSVECCHIRVYMFLYISVSPTEPENQGSLPAYHWTHRLKQCPQTCILYMKRSTTKFVFQKIFINGIFSYSWTDNCK